ncbi:MAG: hypothetical protein JNK82_27315 [Myxococcaceae bacterium]|nr:hypothetical protein [Myxococcaceae bacterium]
MRVLTGGLLLLLAPAAYAEKLVVAPFGGPGGAAVRSQIADNLCSANTCLDPKKATKGYKPDFTKGKKAKVDFFVTGTVKAKGAKKTLDLQVAAKPGPPKLKKSFTFTGATLPDAVLEAALAALNKAMGLEAAAAPAKKEEEPPPAKKEDEPPPKKEEEAPPPEEPKKKKEREPTEAPPPPKEEARKPEPKPVDDDAPAPRKEVKPYFVAFEAGVSIFSRNYSYDAAVTSNLRSYSASFVVAPIGRLEFYPLAIFSKGIMSGLGVDGEFSNSVGLKSRRSGTDVTWATNIQNFNFSLRFRIMPSDTVAAQITPFVGFAQRSFSVGTGTDGSTLDGLPAVAYAGIRPGLYGELPFSNSGFSIFGRFAVIVVLSSGQVISGAANGFFPRGSNFGIEGLLGLGYQIVGPVALRLNFDFTRYGLSFRSESSDTYQAGGAVDMYLGGTLSLRLTF